MSAWNIYLAKKNVVLVARSKSATRRPLLLKLQTSDADLRTAQTEVIDSIINFPIQVDTLFEAAECAQHLEGEQAMPVSLSLRALL